MVNLIFNFCSRLKSFLEQDKIKNDLVGIKKYENSKGQQKDRTQSTEQK
jgi:hypothetical protein